MLFDIKVGPWILEPIVNYTNEYRRIRIIRVWVPEESFEK